MAAFGGLKKDDDHEDDSEFSPFFGIEKASVLQEARVFNDPQLDTRRCTQVIVKLLYLINQGETFTKTEATELFFSVTKLFHPKESNLRRMLYLMIKDISPSSDEVIMAVSSLMKDMNGKVDLYRANAIRVLCKIMDPGLLGQVERYLKQAVVDKNPLVASAAIVSGIHLLKVNPEIVRRWSNEVQDAVQSKHSLVQFHALALLHQIKQNDRLAVSKLVTSLSRGTLRSPLAQCLLVRYTSQVIKESAGSAPGGERPYFDYLESCFRHKSEMVAYEAARIVTSMSNVTSRELSPAITSLQMLLTSSKPVHRFSAVRTLSKVAMSHPLAVTNCNIDMESLISDQNRSIATLAITTLLKTGNESGVDRLMKQITNFMSDIADEFKIVVVEAIRSLCLKFPQKYRTLMNFLSGILREEGGFDYKKSIVDSILILINEIPEAKESGLAHLCEFIEDCEFTYLSTQILHLLGLEGPKTLEPGKYIRYIYNRVILENATVRASAVSSLAKFGLAVESLRPRIAILLKRCLYDNDDEVRDRATLYLSAISYDDARREEAKHALFDPLDIPLANLEESLQNYVPSDTPFDIYAVSRELKPQLVNEKKSGRKPDSAPKGIDSSAPAPSVTALSPESRLASIPGFSAFGKLFKSSAPVELTEADTDYTVSVVKHVYPEHIVFEFTCTNTVVDQCLEEVSVVAETDNDEFQMVLLTPIKSLPYNNPGQAYAVFKKPEGPCMAKFANKLKFVPKEVDPATGEPMGDDIEDEYQVEDFEVTTADYFLRMDAVNFHTAWESLEFEYEDEYALEVRESVQEPVQTVLAILGLEAVEGTQNVQANARSHTCLLMGKFINGAQVLVRLAFGIDAKKQVMMKVVARSDQEDMPQLIHDTIASA